MIDALLDLLLDPASLAALVAGVAAFAAIVTAVAPSLNQDRLGTRLKAVAEKREELRRKSRQQLQETSKLRDTRRNWMQELVNRLNLAQTLADDTIQKKLLQAGFRGQRPIAIYYFFRFTAPFVFALAATVYLFTLGASLELTGTMKLLIITGSFAAGFYAPNVYVSNLINKRRDSIMRAFPDALDMLLICVESGMSIDLAMQRVGQEIGPASVELAEEFTLTCAELSYLPERRLAFENMSRRTDHPGVRSVAMALVQAERYGTPLGQALRVMAKENRELRLTSAEKKAAALPAKLTVPMILFFLPVLFAVILSPAIIQIMGVEQ